MNIPIREMLDDEQNLKRTMSFEFEVGYYDQSGVCRKVDKIKVSRDSEHDNTLDHES